MRKILLLSIVMVFVLLLAACQLFPDLKLPSLPPIKSQPSSAPSSIPNTPIVSPEVETQETPKPNIEIKSGNLAQDLKISVFGDSIMINVEPFLKQKYKNIEFYSKVGDQISEVQDLIHPLDQAGKLGDIVVIELGTNGPCPESTIHDIIKDIGSERIIIFCTTHVPRRWEAEINQKIEEVVPQYPNASVADWHEISANHAEYFARDGYHPTITGSKVYAALIQKEIEVALAKQL